MAPPRTQHPASPSTFTLEISTSNPPPALLGFNTLSLSLPGAPRGTRSKTTPTQDPPRISITNIPTAQVHLLFASASLDASVRSGFWIYVKPGEECGSVSVRWDAEGEGLEVVSEVDDRGTGGRGFEYWELVRLKAGSGSGSGSGGDAGGGDIHDEWDLLTRCIMLSDLSRLIPGGNRGDGVQVFPISTLSTSSADTMTATPDLSLTAISLRNTFPPTSIGQSRTQHSLDKSWYLSTLTHSSSSSSDTYGQPLLAELSFVFVTATLLGTPCATQQWKDILSLSLRCRAAAADTQMYVYFVELLGLLGAQLRYLGLFEKGEITKESVVLESDGEVGMLGDLVAGFGRGVREMMLSSASSAPSSEGIPLDMVSTTPLESVRQAYTALADSVAESTLNWNLSDALLLDNKNDGAENGKLQRRILRGVEGFGYHVSNDGGWSESEDDEDEGPVVLDLEGLLKGDGDDDDGEEGEKIKEIEVERL